MLDKKVIFNKKKYLFLFEKAGVSPSCYSLCTTVRVRTWLNSKEMLQYVQFGGFIRALRGPTDRALRGPKDLVVLATFIQ